MGELTDKLSLELGACGVTAVGAVREQKGVFCKEAGRRISTSTRKPFCLLPRVGYVLGANDSSVTSDLVGSDTACIIVAC